MVAYLNQVAEVRNLLDRRHDDVKRGLLATVDGKAFFENLRQPQNQLFKRRPPK